MPDVKQSGYVRHIVNGGCRLLQLHHVAAVTASTVAACTMLPLPPLLLHYAAAVTVAACTILQLSLLAPLLLQNAAAVTASTVAAL